MSGFDDCFDEVVVDVKFDHSLVGPAAQHLQLQPLVEDRLNKMINWMKKSFVSYLLSHGQLFVSPYCEICDGRMQVTRVDNASTSFLVHGKGTVFVKIRATCFLDHL